MIKEKPNCINAFIKNNNRTNGKLFAQCWVRMNESVCICVRGRSKDVNLKITYVKVYPKNYLNDPFSERRYHHQQKKLNLCTCNRVFYRVYDLFKLQKKERYWLYNKTI